MCHRVVKLVALDGKSLDYQLTNHLSFIEADGLMSGGFHADCLLEASDKKVTVGCMERQRENIEVHLDSTSHPGGKTKMNQLVRIFDDHVVAVDYRMAVIVGRQTERLVFPGLNVPNMAISRSMLKESQSVNLVKRHSPS